MNSNKCSYTTRPSLAWHEVCTSLRWLRTTGKLNVKMICVADIVNKMTQVMMPPSHSSKLLILNKKLLRVSLQIVRPGNVNNFRGELWFAWVCQCLQPRGAKMMFFSPRMVLGEWSLSTLCQKKYPQNANPWTKAQSDTLTLLWYDV